MIEKERFEAWLFNSDRARTFDYLSNDNCLVCIFLKETTSHNAPVASRDFFVFYDGGSAYVGNRSPNYPMPNWLLRLLDNRPLTDLTFGDMQDVWIALYGHPESHPVQIEHVIEPEELMEKGVL